MGKKYVIELNDECNSEFKGILAFGLTQEKQISVELIPEESLTPYTEPDLDAIRKEAYDKGCETAKHECEQCRKVRADAEQELAEKAYQRGLNDAWAVARKIALMDTETSENVTGYFGLFRIMENLTPMQAIKKIRQYEQEKEKINVGDEIVRSNGEKYVVLIVNDERKLVTILRHDGYERTIESKWVTKTGRHFPEIAEVLKKMRETE